MTQASRRILVTGATGFIGGCLARHLAAQGYWVRALVRRDAPGLARHGVELALGDLRDAETLRAAMCGVELVLHLAAARDVWGTRPTVYQQTNVEGTRCLLDAAAEAGVERFVYCSSVGVARYPGNLQADETLPYADPTSQVSYHRTKTQAERMALEAQAIVVRPAITYGPGDETGFVTSLISLLARGRFLWVGDGQNHVDLVYVDDLVAGMKATLERGVAGRVYILSGTAPIRVRQLVNDICRLLRKEPPRVSVPTWLAHLTGWGMEMLWQAAELAGWHRCPPPITRDKVATLTIDRGFSHKRAELELGYRPQVDYADGLRRTLDWLKVSGPLARVRKLEASCELEE